MAGVASSLRALGGVARTTELNSAGFGAGAIRLATINGEIIRVRKGWYASAGTATDAVEAIRVGGRLACVSAAIAQGLWVPDLAGLHVEVPPSSSRLRTPSYRNEVVPHWSAPDGTGDRISVSASTCIRQVFICQGFETGFVVLESALRRGRLDEVDGIVLQHSLPTRIRQRAAAASRKSDSGTESLLKLLLIELGITFRQQVPIAGVGPVDFLVGTSLVLEADSKQFHADLYRDRKKDAELSVLGYRTLRFMYSQVRYEREHVAAAVLAAVSRGDHLL
jgi:very-short-patch-repair endonuclease